MKVLLSIYTLGGKPASLNDECIVVENKLIDIFEQAGAATTEEGKVTGVYVTLTEEITKVVATNTELSQSDGKPYNVVWNLGESVDNIAVTKGNTDSSNPDKMSYQIYLDFAEFQTLPSETEYNNNPIKMEVTAAGKVYIFDFTTTLIDDLFEL
ncbi:hypothetical protein [Bacillus sp. 1P06AnD]|uniref:hypothetical protein n=1 Tax=Bacillus sp. 1P06AnD TaxID=3132208 RepID=UPI00399FC378